MTRGMRTTPRELPNGNRDWMVGARCRQVDPELFFSFDADRKQEAKTICAHCPVLAACTSYALDNRISWGIWAGLTESQRRAIWARRDGNNA